MPWKLIEVFAEDVTDDLLTDKELLGIGIVLNEASNVTSTVLSNKNHEDVYRRAWRKIQPQVQIAIERI